MTATTNDSQKARDNGDLSGDGPIWHLPRGTICHIEPVDPTADGYSDRTIKIDISSVLEGYADAGAAGANLGQPTEEGTSR